MSFQQKSKSFNSTSSKKTLNFSLINSKIENIKTFLTNYFKSENIKKVGVGVSGGADSMLLLNILCDVCKNANLPLFVLTVNHNVREEKISAADSDFVIDFCNNLNGKIEKGGQNLSGQNNFKIVAEKKTIEKNKIFQLAKERDKGEEEAARFLRYKFFDEFCKTHKIDIFCLGHNKTDQLETLIQRFLQGSSVFKNSGIPMRRGVFFRPLLALQKDEITFFAQKSNIPFRLDATNEENIYKRNKIRNQLLPILNEHFAGWDTAVLHGAEKASDFVNILENLKKNCVWQIEKNKKNCVKMPLNQFESLELPYKIEILYDALICVKYSKRLSYEHLRNFCQTKNNLILNDLSINRAGDFVFVELKNNLQTQRLEKTGFFIEIFDSFSTNLKDFSISVCVTQNENLSNTKDNFKSNFEKNNNFLGPFPFPCVLRNRQSADKIKDANGCLKPLTKVF